MRLNNISRAAGARRPRRRVGRGMGSGVGKTCGRGHKGQHSRSGGFHKVGFEGGQMPLQRRLPKRGFNSRKQITTSEIRTSELNKIEGGEVTLDSLRAAGLISGAISDVKIMLSGEITAKVVVKGLRVSKGAQAAIEKAGGSVEAPVATEPAKQVKKDGASTAERKEAAKARKKEAIAAKKAG